MPEDVMSLEQRVATLERALASTRGELDRVTHERRRAVQWSRLAAGALVAGVATVLLGAARGGSPAAMQEPQVLTVRAPFKVVDEAGRDVLRVEAGGDRGLMVFTGDERIGFLGQEGSFVGLEVWNKAGSMVGNFGDDGSGNPGLAVYNAAEEPVAEVGTSKDEGGYVAAYDQGRANQAQLKVNSDEAGFFMINAGKPGVQLGRFAKGNAALKIAAGGKVVASMGESIDGSGGAFILGDASGETKIKAANAPGQGGQVVVYGTGGGQAGIATKGNVGSAFAGPIDAPIAKMGESETTPGAGHLMLAAPGGGSAVQAGYKGSGGLVVAYGQGKPAAILSPGIKIPGFTAGANW